MPIAQDRLISLINAANYYRNYFASLRATNEQLYGTAMNTGDIEKLRDCFIALSDPIAQITTAELRASTTVTQEEDHFKFSAKRNRAARFRQQRLRQNKAANLESEAEQYETLAQTLQTIHLEVFDNQNTSRSSDDNDSPTITNSNLRSHIESHGIEGAEIDAILLLMTKTNRLCPNGETWTIFHPSLAKKLTKSMIALAGAMR